jgi:hypothetical protein
VVGLPSSPRARRRLVLAAAAAAVLGAGLAVALLVPGKAPKTEGPTGPPVPAQVAETVRRTLGAADRRAIDATLDRFLPAGMERRDAATAWKLAGPELRSGSTLAQWRAGTSPIPYYLPRETTFHEWRTIEVGRRYVVFNLLLHSRHPRRIGSYVFSGQVVKQHGRWLVNRLYTIAIMNPPQYTTTHELGPADYASAGAHGHGSPDKPLLGHVGIAPALGILALVLLVPLSIGGVAVVRARRWRRHVRASDRRTLPPLPSGYLKGPE